MRGPDWLDSRQLARCAAEKGVLIEPGDVFFRRDNAPLNHFRLAYSSIPESRIEEGVARLAAVVEELRLDVGAGADGPNRHADEN